MPPATASTAAPPRAAKAPRRSPRPRSTSYTDTGLTNGTTYYYKVSATNSAGTSAQSSEVSATPSASRAASLQISAGGPATGTWAADEDFTGGATSATTNAISTTGVTNPAPQSVYQHNRYGNFTYTIPGFTAGATYTVRLHFAEEYWTTAGSRIFNVLIDGTQVLTNFDIFATAGGEYKAVVEQFTETAPSNGDVHHPVLHRQGQRPGQRHRDPAGVTGLS